MGTGGLGSDPEAVDEIVAPGVAHGDPLSAPHAEGMFDTMHGAGPEPPVYDEIEDEPTSEISRETCLRFDPDHSERGLRLTADDRVRIERGVKMLYRWMTLVGAPLERSDIERQLIKDAITHLRAHPSATFSSCVVNAVRLRRPRS